MTNRQRTRLRTSSSSKSTYGTSASRYSFAGTRFRVPGSMGLINATGPNNFVIAQSVHASPAYTVSNPRFAMTNWSQASGGAAEVVSANDITVEAVSIKVGSGAFTPVATGLPITLPGGTGTTVLLDAIAVTIPPNTTYQVRVAATVPSSTSSTLPVQARNQTIGEGVEGRTTSYNTLAYMTGVTPTVLGGGGAPALGSYMPLYMIAQGGDGRPCFLLYGDSIGYGANDNSDFNNAGVSNWSTRYEFGYLGRGLDDATATKRIPFLNLCIPGSRPQDINAATGRNGTFIKLKMDAVKLAYTATGAWPFDELILQHGTNSIGGGTTTPSMLTLMKECINVLRGDVVKPVTQVEMICKASTSDGWATEANQTVLAQDNLSNARWGFNYACSNQGVQDPTVDMRANGYIIGSIVPWLYGSYDPTNASGKRDKIRLMPFKATINGAVGASVTVFPITAVSGVPVVGMGININNGFSGHILIVTPTGGSNYTITTTQLTGASPAYTGGEPVQEMFHALDGTHPMTPGHRDYYAQAVTDWKTARGFV